MMNRTKMILRGEQDRRASNSGSNMIAGIRHSLGRGGDDSGNSLNANCRFSRLATRRLLRNGQPSFRWQGAANPGWRAFRKEIN